MDLVPAHRRPAKAVAGGVLGLALALGPLALPSAADAGQRVFNATLTVSGAGYGHGIGLSQHGAYGAARAGLAWRSILSFYYPGTTRASLPAGNTMRVWISADSDGDAAVVPQAGLRIASEAGGWHTLPAGPGHTRWRMRVVGGARVAEHRTASGAWQRFTPRVPLGLWHFENPSAGYVQLLLPNGTIRELRGRTTVRMDSRARTVNTVTMESYLRSVVPAEMPPSWHAQALAAQAVAARTYAARARSLTTSSTYDTCDTTTCQMYVGAANRAGGVRTPRESASTDAAVAATASQVLRYGSGLALTMFSSSNGGQTAPGGTPYLVSKADPYDGRVTNQAWTKPLSQAQIQQAYPALGRFTVAQIVSREGRGRWGGRVNAIRLHGTAGSVQVSGAAFRIRFGLRSHLLTVAGGLKPGTPTYRRWAGSGAVKGWVGAPASSERTSRGFTEVRFDNADLGWSSAGGAHYVARHLRARWRAMGGIGSVLGAPTSDLTAGPVSGSQKTLFSGGGLYYSARTGVHEVHGPIFRTYAPRASRLGLPTKDQTAAAYVRGASYSWFQRGAIYHSAATGAHAIERPALTAYASVGYEKSRLRLPTASTAATSTGTITRFQGGAISCTGARACTVAYS